MANSKSSQSNKRKSSTKTASNKNTKKNTGRKTSNSKNSKKNGNLSEEDLIIINYLVIIVTVFACVLLFLSNFGVIGTVGDGLSRIMFGLFGSLAYIFPIVLLIYAFMWISKQADESVGRKMLLLVLMFFFSAVLSDMFKGYTFANDTYNLKDVWLYGYEDRIGGGILAGSFAFLLNSLVDRFATISICVLILLICFFLLFGKYLVNAFNFSSDGLREAKEEISNRNAQINEYRAERIKKRREEAVRSDEYEEYDEDPEERYLRRKEEKQRKQEEKRAREAAKQKAKEEEETNDILRMDKKKSGVSLDTSLKGSQAQRRKDDMHEINIDDSLQSTYAKEVAIARDSNPYDGKIKFHMQDYEDSDKQNEDENEIEIFAPEPEQKNEDLNATKPAKPVASATVNEAQSVNASAPRIKAQPVSDTPKPVKKTKKYVFPGVDLLEKSQSMAKGDSRESLAQTAADLVAALESYGVKAEVTDISQGPSVTRYELKPDVGVKVSRITALADDLKMCLAAKDIRIEAPIPGKSAVGIEVPNATAGSVKIRELVESQEFKKFDGNMIFAVGKDIAGKVIVSDISKMPHMLIAGSTGSGKSVCINTIIMSILYKHTPDEVQLIMVDPKVVELNVYNGIPHLMVPVVTDPKKAAAALNWAVAEMTDRYKKFADMGVRDLKGYNKKVEDYVPEEGQEEVHKLPQILIIVDELADLMMVAAKEVEEAICRLAQLARACGIHLILATQRPSVDVITGLIKANMPSRVAFAVSSGVDSRTILDMNGAEKLLGKGDMLFFPQGYTKPSRIQGAFVSDNEVSAVVDFVKEKNGNFDKSQDASEAISNFSASSSGSNSAGGGDGGSEIDELFVSAGRFIIEQEKASIGNLQRKFRIGFNRAARIMDELCDAGVVGPEAGTKPRDILMSREQFDQYVDEYYV